MFSLTCFFFHVVLNHILEDLSHYEIPCTVHKITTYLLVNIIEKWFWRDFDQNRGRFSTFQQKRFSYISKHIHFSAKFVGILYKPLFWGQGAPKTGISTENANQFLYDHIAYFLHTNNSRKWESNKLFKRISNTFVKNPKWAVFKIVIFASRQ